MTSSSGHSIRADSAGVDAALRLLQNASAINLPLAAVAVDGIMGSARAVYAAACTPANTKLITQAIDHILSDPTYREDPEIRAFYANVRCCDYLNHWNDAGIEVREAAERSVAIALRSNPKHRRAVYVSAFLNRALGKRKEALAAFNRVIALNPNANDRMLAEAYAQAGAEWMHLGNPEKTQELVDKAIAITPSDSPALGVFFWISGRRAFIQREYLQAIDFLERSVAIRTNFWYTRAYLTAAYALNNQLDKARQALDEFRALFPRLDSVSAVIKAEDKNPNSHNMMVEARERMHKALISLLGFPP
jgi:tetratricopeptide (TPR) repeat protein